MKTPATELGRRCKALAEKAATQDITADDIEAGGLQFRSMVSWDDVDNVLNWPMQDPGNVEVITARLAICLKVKR